jgi:hypothetical protein
MVSYDDGMGMRAEAKFTQEVIVLDEVTSAKLTPAIDALAAMLVADPAISGFLERKGWTGQMLAWNTLLRTLVEGYEPDVAGALIESGVA